MSPAQRRLLNAIQDAGEWAEYWPIVNDWVKDRGRAKSLALCNINRCVDVLIRHGYVTLNDDGLFMLTEKGRVR